MTPPSQPEVISVRLPSRLDLLSLLDCITSSVCERLRFGSDVATRVSMSVIEAGTNAIQHGHKRDPSRVFDVDYRIFGDRLEIAVHDTGAGFDPSTVNGDMTSPDHLFDARGRGIFIMRNCMDAVDFEFSEAGTVCRLVMRRAASEASASG